jgi:hypothetical protein
MVSGTVIPAIVALLCMYFVKRWLMFDPRIYAAIFIGASIIIGAALVVGVAKIVLDGLRLMWG